MLNQCSMCKLPFFFTQKGVCFLESFTFFINTHFLPILLPAVGSSVSSLSGLYTTAMKAAGASRRVFQLLDRISSMPKSGDKCPRWLVYPPPPPTHTHTHTHKSKKKENTILKSVLLLTFSKNRFCRDIKILFHKGSWIRFVFFLLESIPT